MENGGEENGGGRVGDGGRNQTQASSTKSCKGYLMYDSVLKSKGRCPRCIGFSRTLPSDSGHIVRHPEIQALKEGRRLIDFYYACVGYAVYRDGKDISSDEEKTEVPGCLGFELLVEKRAQDIDAIPVNLRGKEEAMRLQERLKHKPEPLKPIHPTGGDDFYTRFTRNAGLVAAGVVANMLRVGIFVKQNIDEILDRRPK